MAPYIRIARKPKARDVIDVPSDPFGLRGVPSHIRSDNGPAFVAPSVRDCIAAVGPATASIEPGSRWENGCCESFHAKLRDERLDGEVFYTLKEASVVIGRWRRHDNTLRPHASLGSQPHAPEVVIRPTEPSGSTPLAHPTIVTRPTMHALRTRAAEWGQAKRGTTVRPASKTAIDQRRAVWRHDQVCTSRQYQRRRQM